MASVLNQVRLGTPASAATPAPERDPVQREQGLALLNFFRSEPPGQWLSNHFAECEHYTGPAFLALSRVLQAWSSAVATLERRRRRDRTTFGPGGAVSVVKAHSADGGAGNDEDYAPYEHDVISPVLHEPNEHESFGSLLGYVALQKGLTGEAPVWFVPGANHGRPVELYALNTALLQPALQAPSALYPEGAWRFTPWYAGSPTWAYGTLLGRSVASGAIIPGREVRRLLNPHPLTKISGYSTFRACGIQLDVLESIDLARHSQMLQGARPGVVIVIPGLTQEQVDATGAQFKEQYGGARNYMKTLFYSPPPGVDAGKATVSQMTPAADELVFKEGWDQATNFVFASFDVLPTTIGLSVTGSYAERYAARQDQHDRWQGGIKCAADFFTRHLARPWSKKPGELRVKISLPKVMNLERDTPSVQDLVAANAIRVNELRALKDMPPLPHGELPPALYAAKLQSESMPQPQPTATPDGAGEESGPPRPVNPAGKGTLPPRPTVGKALRGDDLVAKVLSGLED